MSIQQAEERGQAHLPDLKLTDLAPPMRIERLSRLPVPVELRSLEVGKAGLPPLPSSTLP